MAKIHRHTKTQSLQNIYTKQKPKKKNQKNKKPGSKFEKKAKFIEFFVDLRAQNGTVAGAKNVHINLAQSALKVSVQSYQK